MAFTASVSPNQGRLDIFGDQYVREQITNAIFSAIDEINQQLTREQRLPKSADAMLFSDSGPLDSLGLVNLIVLVEQKVEEQTGCPVSLANDEALSLNDSPFRSVGRLRDYIAMLLEKQPHG